MIPSPALWIGLAGLIPFYAAVIWRMFAEGPDANSGEMSFTLYAAVILSFLGGTRWGREVAQSMGVPRTRELSLSILPALGGWLAAAAHLGGYQQIAWAGLILAFALAFFWDWRGSREGVWPEWYGRLRLILSFGAVLSAAVMIILNA